MELLGQSHRALLLLFFMMMATASWPADPPAKRTPPPSLKSEAGGLPSGMKIAATHIGADEKTGAVVAEGEVTIEAGFGRIQADRITFREGRIVEAEGNVLLVWGNNRISGTRMTYDMGKKDDPDPEKRVARGVIENAVGQVEPEFFFDAEEVDTIGDDRVVLHHATVTTCTQPVPYWSFRVSTAKIKLEGYAHMYNLRTRIRSVPFFYLPYLIWPVKRERAPGLLFPEFGAVAERGFYTSIPVFVPIGRSADVTFFPEYYTIGGWAFGMKARVIPNRDGYAEAETQYIADQLTGQNRYRVQLKQTQSFLNGFRMVSDVDIVSDFNYFTDFVRNLTYASSPTILGRMTFTRNGPWTTILVQEQYREQLFAPTLTDPNPTLLQTTLPEISWRGRSKKIGNTPIYFTYISSVAAIGQDSDTSGLHARYMRGDLFPTFSAPFSPWAWLDVTPSLSLRSTYWSEQQQPSLVPGDNGTIVESGLWRNLLSGSVDVRGPKLVRIFEGKPKPPDPDDPDAKPVVPKWKNTIEPSLVYNYQQAFDKNANVIVYDEVDQFGAVANTLTYGLASRLIGQRPRAETERPNSSDEKILVPEGASGKLREAPSATLDSSDVAATPLPEDLEKDKEKEKEKEKAAPLEPIEIASLELAQGYSFNTNFSSADLDGDPLTPPSTSHFGPVSLTGRYNPSRALSFNLTGRYDILFKAVSDVSLSGNFRENLAQGTFSLVYHAGLGLQQVCTATDPITLTCIQFNLVSPKDQTQIRFQGNFGPFASRVRAGVDGTYNVSPGPGEKKLPYRRLRLEYYTQCCGFLAEYLLSEYSTFPRREFRLAVDLRGIGKLFDFNQANQ